VPKTEEIKIDISLTGNYYNFTTLKDSNSVT